MEALHFWDLVKNPIIVPAFIAWLTSQLLKAPCAYLLSKKSRWTIIFDSGGMPSSHSAFTMSTAVSVGLHEGWASVAFAIAIAFALVVMFDAAGVRQAVGKQAVLLNDIVKHIEETGDFQGTPEKIRELLGHTPFEVVIGALYGILIAILYFLFIYQPV